MKKYSLSLAAAVAMISFLFQCARFEPTPERILSCFKQDEPESSRTEPKKVVKIYIDGSGSMAGFVRTQGNSVFGQLLERLRSMGLPGYSKEFYKFAGEIESVSDGDVHRASSQPWFFGGSATRLSKVCSMFNKCPAKELPAAYVIVTDGVQSTPEGGSDYVAVSNVINEWLKKYSFQILGMRSQFKGDFYSEVNIQKGSGAPKFKYASTEGEIKTYRPCYLYIFASDDSCAKEIVARIRPAKMSPDYHLVDFSSKISGEYGEYAVNFSAPERINPRSKELNPLKLYARPAEFPNMIKLDWKKEKSGKASQPGYLRVELYLHPTEWMRAFIRNPDSIRLETECCSFPRKGVSAPSTPAPTVFLESASVKGEPGEDLTVSLLLGFKDELPSEGWYAYRIRLLPKLETFGAAPWVTEWSTDIDTEPKFASKTLKLTQFISCLLEQPSLIDQPLGEIYVGIRRR